VAEGEREQKLEKIRHSDFLSKAYRSFLNISTPLFIDGHSLAENDEHFLHLIEKGKIEQVFVSVYGDPTEAGNRKKISRGLALADARSQIRKTPPLEVSFYDAASANVWG
jgi:hypothetical protein